MSEVELEQVGCRIREDDLGLELLSFFRSHRGISHNDNDIANLNFSRSCAIEANTTAASASFNDIGFKSLTVIVIDNINVFAF